MNSNHKIDHEAIFFFATCMIHVYIMSSAISALCYQETSPPSAALECIESTRTSFHRCSVLACKLPCFSPSAVNLFSWKEGVRPNRVEYCIELNHWFFRLPRPLIHGSLAHTTLFRLQLTRTPLYRCFVLACMLPCYTPIAVNPFSWKEGVRPNTTEYRIELNHSSLAVSIAPHIHGPLVHTTLLGHAQPQRGDNWLVVGC